MDSRLILPILIAGWLSLTIGIWGACGMPWWIFPLSGGVGLLAGGGVMVWAAIHQTPEEPAGAGTVP